MADDREEQDQTARGESIFELFGDPPPEPDPQRFGPVPVVRPGDPPDDEAPEPSAGDEAGGAGPGDDELALPHWSEPPTGQVPRVLAGERPDDPGWSNVSGPRWRGEEPAWATGDDLAGVFADEEGVTRPQVFTFDDIDADLADLPPAAGAPQRHDPIAPRPRPAASPPPRAEVYDDDLADRNVGLAIAVGVVFAAIAALAFLDPATTMVLIAVLAGVCGIELFKAMQDGGLRPATLLGITGVVLLPLAVYARGEAAYPLVLFLAVAFGALWYIVGADHHRPVANLGVTLFGIAYIGGLAGFGALLLRSPNGVGLLLAAVIATIAYDVGAYAVGRLAGSRPLTRISPRKTWEGVVGGTIAAVFVSFMAVGLIADGITPFGGPEGQLINTIWLGLVVAVAAPLGDLAESLIKRDLGIKDFGGLLPGHGGMLDRVDSLLFTMPAVYYLARILGLS
jgi:phosphatidate cytidylyltransferase